MKIRDIIPLPSSIYVNPEDELRCTITDSATDLVFVHTEKIGREMVVDTIVTFDIETPTLGLKSGIGAVFGERS